MKITFVGKYGGGASLFASENVLPNPIEELSQIAQWPHSFVPGTFNIDVDVSKWPQIEGLNFRLRGVTCLDRTDLFQPAAYLHYTTIPNNTLNPMKNGEYAGDLQFWRAVLRLQGIEETVNCYMLRRVKSGYRNKIEVVSDIHFKDTFQIQHGHYVELTVFSKSNQFH